MAEEIPFRQITVVDFSAFSIAHQEVPGETDPTVQQMVKDLYAGCNTFGFVYLTNHGIPQEEIDNALQTMDNFFTLDSCLKEKYKKQVKKGWSGWEDAGSETLDEKTGADLKEAFDISAKGDEEFVFPGDDLIPGFKSTVLGFRNRLSKLTDRSHARKNSINPSQAGAMAEDVTSCPVPVVDFSAFSIAHQEVPGTTDPTVQQLVKDLYAGCSTFGFVYLTNHGIAQVQVDSIFQTVAAFFSLEPAVKEKYKKQLQKGVWCGWEGLESQKISEKRAGGDLKESLDIVGRGYEDFEFPSDDLIPSFKTDILEFYDRINQLTARVITALAISLDVKPEIFFSAHKDSLSTALRFNYYPQLKNADIKPGQIRCGEHSDWGSITLLFQDDAGGLEIATEDGTFIPVTPIPGTVLVNIADLMQRWTSDRLKSVVHRVIIPKEQYKKEKSRQSIAFFMNPSDEAVISCLDGSNKYPPVKAGKYIADLFAKSYSY